MVWDTDDLGRRDIPDDFQREHSVIVALLGIIFFFRTHLFAHMSAVYAVSPTSVLEVHVIKWR